MNNNAEAMGEKKKRKRSDRFGVIVMLTVLLMLAGQLLGALLEFIPSLCVGPITYTGLSYLEFIGIWIVTLLYLYLTKKNRPILSCLWRKPSGNNWKNLLLGFAIGFGLNAICILVAWLHGDIKLYFDSFHPLGLIYVFITVFIQSSAEELLCRGFMYQWLLKSYQKPAVAIIGNAALFAMLHLFNDGVTVLSMVNIFTVGILFSFMVYYMDSLWCAMAVHTAWNFTQNIIFGLPNSGRVVPFSVLKLDAATAVDSFAYNVGFGIEGTLLADLVLIAACVALYLWGKNHASTPIDIWQENEAEYV